MTSEMVDHFRKIYQDIEFPTNAEITEQSKTVFTHAKDTLLMYRGHPNTLLHALEIFLKTDCRPLAYAGAAEILIHASYISNNDYDSTGLKHSVDWLNLARQDSESCYEIELVQAQLDFAMRTMKKIPNTLEKISQLSGKENDFYTAILNMQYWSMKKNKSKFNEWEKLADTTANNDYQKLYILRQQADNQASLRNWQSAIDYNKKLLAIDRQDPWAWHNNSIYYLYLNNLHEAERCNDIALVLMDFGAARGVREDIQQRKRNATNWFTKLFGR